VDIDPQARVEVDRITREIAGLEFVLPGTVLHRQARCGKPSCRCHADPPQPHPPFWSWTRKVDGKTITRRLSEAQRRDYQPWFDNARRLRQLTAELEDLSLRLLSHDPQWGRK
jgi:Family of unknown function (DUF6788)